jgi:hypothetical protein
MSYSLVEKTQVAGIPVDVLSSTILPTHPAYTSTDIFPVDPGTRYINVILKISSATTEDFYVMMEQTLKSEPAVPDDFDVIRDDNYSAGVFEQIPVEKKLVSVKNPGGIRIVSFELKNSAPKWCRVDISCSKSR